MRLEIKSSEDIKKLQELAVDSLKRGELVDKELIKLYPKIKNIEVSKNEELSKNIDFLKSYYEQMSEEEKFLVNNLLFVLEIINGNSKEGLKEYLIRGLKFHTHTMAANPEAMFFVDFIQNLDESEYLIDIVKDIFRHYFEFNEKDRRAFIVNTLAVLWNNKYLYVNKIWLDVFDILVDVIKEAVKKELIEDVMPLQFLIYHIYGNNVQTIDEWRIFNERVERITSNFYKEWAKKKGIDSNNQGDKKKIGFIVSRVVQNSPMIVLYSLLKKLMENEEFKKNYEVYVYSMEYIYKQTDDDEWVRKIRDLGIKVYVPAKFRKDGYYFSHLEKALDLRDLIIKDGVYYLINQVSGYDISNFLFSTRTAPKQIYWSHGNCAFDIEGIDERISHFEQVCKEFDWKIFDVEIAREFLVGSEKEKKQGQIIKESILKEYGKDKVILGTIGRLIKINSDEYIKVISKIMEENPNTIYLACGEGEKEEIEKKLEKFEIDRERFIFVGHVNPHIFGWVIDIWPDTFPLGGGHSRDEFIAKKRPVVFHIKREEKYAEYEKGEFLAYSDEEYIRIINKLITDKDYRKKLGEKEYKVWIKERGKYKKEFLEAIGVKNV